MAIPIYGYQTASILCAEVDVKISGIIQGRAENGYVLKFTQYYQVSGVDWLLLVFERDTGRKTVG